MKEIFIELYNYHKNRILEKDSNLYFGYKFKNFGYLLVICLIAALAISPIFSFIERFGWINMENHVLENMMKQFSKHHILFFAIIIAPFFEKLIFKVPLILLKNHKIYKISFSDKLF